MSLLEQEPACQAPPLYPPASGVSRFHRGSPSEHEQRLARVSSVVVVEMVGDKAGPRRKDKGSSGVALSTSGSSLKSKDKTGN